MKFVKLYSLNIAICVFLFSASLAVAQVKSGITKNDDQIQQSIAIAQTLLKNGDSAAAINIIASCIAEKSAESLTDLLARKDILFAGKLSESGRKFEFSC